MRFLFLSLALGMISEIAVSLWASVMSSNCQDLRSPWLRMADDSGNRIYVSNIAKRRVLRQRKAKVLLALFQRMLKIVVVFAAGMLLLQGAGVNVTTMLAGLGVGGIALALAAQKSLENLLGGISIIMREAIRVGDVCSIAGQTGMIEDIGSWRHAFTYCRPKGSVSPQRANLSDEPRKSYYARQIFVQARTPSSAARHFA